MRFIPHEQQMEKFLIEESKNNEIFPEDEYASQYYLTDEEAHRVKDMLLYVDAPIDRNNMDKLEYQNRLKEHYTFANKHWDQYKIPEWNPKFSKEEESQSKAGEENYDRLVNDNTIDYSQQPFEVQEAKEISKMTYKDDFLHIMSQPDSLRMNSINRMVKERSKLKMPSSFANDVREQMQAPNNQFNSGTESQEQKAIGQAQANPVTYTPKTNEEDRAGGIEMRHQASAQQMNEKSHVDDSSRVKIDITDQKNTDRLEKSNKHITLSPKLAADKPKSLLGNALLRNKQHAQSESVNKEVITTPQQVEYKANNPVDYSDQKEYTPSRGDIRQKMNQLHSLEQKLRNNLVSSTNVSEIQKLQQMYINQLTQLQRDTATYYKDQWWISEEDENIMAETAEFPSRFEGLNTSIAQQEQLSDASRYASDRIGENIYIKHRAKIKNGADFAAGFSDGVLFGQGERIARLAHGDDATWSDEDSAWYTG